MDANIHDPEFGPPVDESGFRFRRARVGHQAGARNLGASVFELEPGDSQFPYHYHYASEELLIVLDGEGSTHLVEVVVRGGRTPDAARRVARAVATSTLCKCAFHGADPNWGRIIMAIGKVPDTNIIAEKVCVALQGIPVLENGFPVVFNRSNLIAELKKETVRIEIDLNIGDFQATAWGCDLTHGYVDVNVSYN